MSKNIYLVRHGQSVANRDNVLGGKETILSELGEQQAEQVALRCQNLDLDLLIASDFTRAKQTASAIAKLKQLPVTTNALFGEFHECSEFIGCSEDDDRVVQYRSLRDMNAVSNPAWLYGDGETVADFLERIKSALKYLEEVEASQVLVVSHAFFIQGLLSCVLMNSFTSSREWLSAIKTFKHSNTGVSMLQYNEGKWRVVMFNDHAHFAE